MRQADMVELCMNEGHSNVDADFCDVDSSSFVFDSGTRHWIPKCPEEFKPRIGMVNFMESDGKLKCSCYNLESRGYIYRHLFCVMFFMRLERIPDYMVIPGWHKEASRKHNPWLYVEESDFSKKTGKHLYGPM
ncbi:unnamed protein product [Rhodiola kirilowii]